MEYISNWKIMTISEVPEWLRSSEIYRNFAEGDGEFHINTDFIFSSSTINGMEDFRKVIQSYSFWCLDQIPQSVFEFIVKQKGYKEQGYQEVKKIFSNYNYLWNKLDILVEYMIEKPNCIYSACDMYPLIEDLANKGFTDCIQFCLYLSEESKELLKEEDVYLQVIESELEVEQKFRAIRELKNMGFQLLHTRCVPFDTEDDYSEYFIWLHRNGSHLDHTTLCSIMETEIWEYRHSFLLSYSLKYGDDKLLSKTMTEACEFNNLEAVQLLIKFNCPCDENALEKAIMNKNLKIMKLLCDYGCPMTNRHIYKAGKYGLLQPLQFLIRQGCSWDESVINILEIKDTPEHNECLNI